MIWLRHPTPGLHPLVELQMRMKMMKSRSEVSVTDPFLQLLRNWTLTGAQLWTTRNSIWNHFQKLLHYFDIIMDEYKQTFFRLKTSQWASMNIEHTLDSIKSMTKKQTTNTFTYSLDWSLLDIEWLRGEPSSSLQLRGEQRFQLFDRRSNFVSYVCN